ncbi:hypothetical protein [Alicyclobacillus herbarius]|nr:hypothetical protein [Alicyclobacillus herbarius]
MEERERTACGICGSELEASEQESAICPECLDAWQREVECTW